MTDLAEIILEDCRKRWLEKIAEVRDRHTKLRAKTVTPELPDPDQVPKDAA